MQQSGTNAQQYQIYDKVMEKIKAYVTESFGEYSLDILNCNEGESYDSFENEEPNTSELSPIVARFTRAGRFATAFLPGMR